ncbi:MAG: capsule assembly Wzi family protein [Spirochaetia bacterium]|nr:capsule assembly Wzi family protein [Spirochaetia bacterium]
MKKLAFILLIVTLAAIPAAAQSAKNLVYDDPVYEFLDKAYSKGWIYYMPDVKPYTEKRALQYLNEVKALVLENPDSLTDSEKEQLYHYIDRLKGDKFNLFSYRGEHFGADANLAPHAGLNADLGDLQDNSSSVGSDFILDLYAGKNVYLGVRSDIYAVLDNWETAPYRLYQDPLKPDFNMYTYNLDTKDKGFNHHAERSVGDTELSLRMDQINQFSADLPFTHISAGRNALNWGPGELASLSLSKTSKPYEYLFFDFPIGGKMYYSWMTGFLRDVEEFGATEDQDKMISSHRFEFQPWKWFMFSVYETVIYSQRFAPGYINPFSLYYISEVFGGDRDNKFGGMDFVFRFCATKLYLSLYMDDWDFDKMFNINYFHNIAGLTAGYKFYDVVPKLDLTLEYTYLSHWMYTHKLFSGDKRNSYSHYGSSAGHFLPPNSQLVYADITYNASPEWKGGLSFMYTQHGFGNINTHAHDDGIGWDIGGAYKDWDDEYKFLDHGISGIHKESNLDFTLHGEYRIPYYGVKLNAAFSLDYTKNKGNIKGEDEWRGILALGAKWQAY